MVRTKKRICYHGRCGHPVVHHTKIGGAYILVRKKGGGVKRLYAGSYYYTGGTPNLRKRLPFNL